MDSSNRSLKRILSFYSQFHYFFPLWSCVLFFLLLYFKLRKQLHFAKIEQIFILIKAINDTTKKIQHLHLFWSLYLSVLQVVELSWRLLQLFGYGPGTLAHSCQVKSVDPEKEFSKVSNTSSPFLNFKKLSSHFQTGASHTKHISEKSLN